MITTLLALIPGLFSTVKGFVSSYFNTKVAIYQAKMGASAEVAVAAVQAEAQVQTKWWFAAIPQTLIGLTVAGYVAKCILWDKVLGSFVGCSGHPPAGTCTTFGTDALGSELNWMFMAVIASYFGVACLDKFLNSK